LGYTSVGPDDALAVTSHRGTPVFRWAAIRVNPMLPPFGLRLRCSRLKASAQAEAAAATPDPQLAGKRATPAGKAGPSSTRPPASSNTAPSSTPCWINCGPATPSSSGDSTGSAGASGTSSTPSRTSTAEASPPQPDREHRHLHPRRPARLPPLRSPCRVRARPHPGTDHGRPRRCTGTRAQGRPAHRLDTGEGPSRPTAPRSR
jgi:hypothetical protein